MWVLFISRGRVPVARAITEDLVSTFIHILGGGVYRAGAHFLEQEYIRQVYIKALMRILVLSLNLYLGVFTYIKYEYILGCARVGIFCRFCGFLC